MVSGSRHALLLVVLVFAGRTAAWTPQPTVYNIPLAKPVSNDIVLNAKTQRSLYPPKGPVTIMAGSDVIDMSKARGPHVGHPVIVAMYADWCPHCWHLVPKWVTLAEAFAGSKDLEVAAVNCADAVNREACDRAKVAAFPDIQCYGCPVSKMCPKTDEPCVVSIGFQTQEVSIPRWLANWISNATEGKVKPTHPEYLDTIEPGDHHVFVEGPPGKPGFIPSAYTPAIARNGDAMRGFLSALWSKNDAKAALKAVEFLMGLFQPTCCKHGGMPDSLRSKAILGLPSLATRLSGAKVNARYVIGNWAATHGVHNLGSNDFATFQNGMLATASEDSYHTCTTFTCALWAFLHMTTTASAYFAAAGSPRLSPGEVMRFTNYFVSEFMTCAACRYHYLESYKNCEFDRCNVGKRRDWKGLVLWLWRVHQGVSLRTAARDNAPVDRRWPSYEDCEACWLPLNFAGKRTVNTFDMQKIGKHSKEMDEPFHISNTYKFIVSTYVGADSISVLGDKVLRQFDADWSPVALANGTSTWMCLSFAGVVIAGIVASLSLWRRSLRSHESGLLPEDVGMESACE